MYEILRTFTPIFRGLNFQNPRSAAVYYVNLIMNFPTNIQHILSEAQAIYGKDITRQALLAGREELLRTGIIGRTYFTEDSDVDFNRETYLPINPEMIWDENLDKVKTYWKWPDEMAFRKAKVDELREHYLKNFKKYGLGIERRSITGLFSFPWMWRGGVNIFRNNYTKRLDIMTNSLEVSIVPDYFDYFDEMLKRGLTMRLLYEVSTKILFDKNTKRKMLKDEEMALKEYRPMIEQHTQIQEDL